MKISTYNPEKAQSLVRAKTAPVVLFGSRGGAHYGSGNVPESGVYLSFERQDRPERICFDMSPAEADELAATLTRNAESARQSEARLSANLKA